MFVFLFFYQEWLQEKENAKLQLCVATTVKTVCNDHIYDKIYYLWFIQ